MFNFKSGSSLGILGLGVVKMNIMLPGHLKNYLKPPCLKFY